MQHDSSSRSSDLDEVWGALGNPIRRRMLDLLKGGPLTTGELGEHFPEHSRFAVMQHLKVLEGADLVVPRRDGRKRFNYLNPAPIQQIYSRWVSDYMQPWTAALVGLKHELEGRPKRA